MRQLTGRCPGLCLCAMSLVFCADLVHSRNVTRELECAADKIDLQLHAGWNAILVKVTKYDAAWAFCARLRTPAGAAPKGIRIDCMHKIKD